MANHGVTTLGDTVADAYNRLYYIERAAQVQIYAMWTGQKSSSCPRRWSRKPSATSAATASYEGPTPAQRHFNALKRILDRNEPDYAT